MRDLHIGLVITRVFPALQRVFSAWFFGGRLYCLGLGAV